MLVHDWKLAPSTYLEQANPVSNKYDKYKAEVIAKLMHWNAARQQESIRKTSAALPYYVVQTEFPSSVLKQCVAQDLEWDIAVGVRSWSLTLIWGMMTSRGTMRSFGALVTKKMVHE